MRMNCFECGSKCYTVYWIGDKEAHKFLDTTQRITHVNKACMNCDWQSFKTKVPEKLV